MADFRSAVAPVLIWEGGEVDNPNDPGGHTNFGISKARFPDEDIANMTEERALFLYWQHYWKPIRGDEIDDQLAATLLLDFKVMSGMATRIAQRVAGVWVDGVIGPKTLAAINSHPNFALALGLERVRYYTNLAYNRPKLREFYLGWIRRVLSYV